MKQVLLSALSIILLCNPVALAEDRTSAGAASPKKLGGDSRNPASKAKPVAPPTDETTTDTAPARPLYNPLGWKPGEYHGGNKPNAILPKATAFGGKGLIPPPPNVMPGLGLPPKKKAKRKNPGLSTAKAEEKVVVVGTGGPFRFKGQQQEAYEAMFQWNPDDKSDKLTFKANFSPLDQPGPHFTWLRIMLGNRILASEQNLRNKTELTLDLTNNVDEGPNQIVISGNGTPGASFDWKLTTPRKVKLTALSPSDEVVVGQDLTLKGENFDPNPAKDQITLGRKNFQPNTATATELKLRIPADFEPGDYAVKVTVDGLTSKELKITVRGIPVLTGTNLQGVPPGATLVVYGKNFSKKIGDNKVTFGGQGAEVVAASPEMLTVVVPNFYTGLTNDTAGVAGQVGIPIKVKVGKVESKNSVPINVGNSTWADPGLQTGPGIETVPVDWRRLLEN